MMTQLANVKTMTMHTLRWAADNSQTLPSPQYPGGHREGDPSIPDQWDFTETGTGLWLDGVVFYAAMFEAQNQRAEEGNEDFEVVESIQSTDGSHLKDTIFFSKQSFKKDPLEDNMYLHSYAMNRSLKFDPIYAQSTDPELTNKNLARILHRPQALLFIENEESNVIGYEDVEMILETGKKRWSSKKVLAGFLDGSARSLGKRDIPADEIDEDREASRFWRGVDPDSYSGE